MKDFVCPTCKTKTKKIWENSDKTTYGMKCLKGHKKKDVNGKILSIDYPVYLVSAQELEEKVCK